MKKIFALMAAVALFAGHAVAQDDVDPGMGVDDPIADTDIRYMTQEYVANPASVVMTWPNAANVTINESVLHGPDHTVDIYKDGVLYTTANIERVEDQSIFNQFQLTLNPEELASGSYQVVLAAGVFDLWEDLDALYDAVPSVATSLTWTITLPSDPSVDPGYDQDEPTGTLDHPFNIGQEDGATIPGTEATTLYGQYIYWLLESNYEGVLMITNNTNNNYGSISKNGATVWSSIPNYAEMLISRHDSVLVQQMKGQFDTSASSIVFNYRPVSDGDVWNRAIALASGVNNIPATSNVSLSRWYKISLTADQSVNISTNYWGTTVLYASAADAATQSNGVVFNTMEGISYTNGAVPADIYLEVKANGNAASIINVNLSEDPVDPSIGVDDPIADDDIRYMTQVYVANPASVVMTWPNALNVTINESVLKTTEHTVDVYKGGVLYTTANIERVADDVVFNQYQLTLNPEELATGDYTVALPEGAFYLWDNFDALYEDEATLSAATSLAWTITLPSDPTVDPGYDQDEPTGTEERPFLIGQEDGATIPGPAAGAYGEYTYYLLESNYEGVLMLTNETGSNYGQVLKNGNSVWSSIPDYAEMLVSRHDTIVIKQMKAQVDATDKNITINYRPVADGDVWNRAIDLVEGENNVPATSTTTLTRWYKISLGAGETAFFTTNYYGETVVYPSAADAYAQTNAITFNTLDGTSYANTGNANYIYVEVKNNNNAASVLTVDIMGAPGAEDNPYAVGQEDGAVIPGTEAAAAYGEYVYYQLDSNWEGVLMITNNTGNNYGAVLKNGQPVWSSIPDYAEMLVSRHDTITFQQMKGQADATGTEIVLNYRAIADGDVWNRAIDLVEGENAVAATTTTTLSRWYKVSLAAGETATFTTDYYGTTAVYPTAADAYAQTNAVVFNTMEGLSYVNEGTTTTDIYVEVKNNNNAASVLTLDIMGAAGSIDNPFAIGQEDGAVIPGTEAATTWGEYLYWQLDSNYEGVLMLTNNTGVNNGSVSKNGSVYWSSIPDYGEMLISRHDTLDIAQMKGQTDATGTEIVLNYRPIADGDVWNRAIDLVEGENAVAATTLTTLSRWYKLNLLAGQTATITSDYFGETVVYASAADAYANNGSSFYMPAGTTFTNEGTDTFIYVEVKNNNNNASILNVAISGSTTTGISTISAEAVRGQVYDLQGRQVKNITRGQIYVVNGAKMFVK